MKIAVCIKLVPNSSQIKIDSITHNLIRENTEMVINPADLNALTEAIRIKQSKDATVDVFTMGAKDAESGLYMALAIGADHAYLISDKVFAGCDSLGTARVMSQAIHYVDSYDMVLCGCVASDGATGQVGPMLAEFMDVSSLSMISGIHQITEDQIEVTRNVRGRKLYISMSFPCVLTVSLGANVPLLPTLRNQMKAKKKEIRKITNNEINIPCEEVGTVGALSIVTDTYTVETSGKKSEMLCGNVQEVARQISELITNVMES